VFRVSCFGGFGVILGGIQVSGFGVRAWRSLFGLDACLHRDVLDELASGDGHTRNVQRFRGGLVFKAHRLCVSLNSRLESNKEDEKDTSGVFGGELRPRGVGFGVS